MESEGNINPNLSDESKSFQERVDEVRALVEENLRYSKSLHDSLNMKGGAMAGQQELQKLLKENLRISKELYSMTQKIKRWVAWQRIWGWTKVLIISIPIIVGLIYLPPIIRKTMQPVMELYRNVLNFNETANQSQGMVDDILKQFKAGEE